MIVHGHLERFDRLEEHTLALVLHEAKRGAIREEIGVSDDAANEKSMIDHLARLRARAHRVRPTQVQVHSTILGRYRLQLEALHPVDLQLKGERRLQVPIDLVLLVALSLTERKVLGEVAGGQRNERHSPHAVLLHDRVFGVAKVLESLGQFDIVALMPRARLDGNVDDVDGFLRGVLVGAVRLHRQRHRAEQRLEVGDQLLERLERGHHAHALTRSLVDAQVERRFVQVQRHHLGELLLRWFALHAIWMARWKSELEFENNEIVAALRAKTMMNETVQWVARV